VNGRVQSDRATEAGKGLASRRTLVVRVGRFALIALIAGIGGHMYGQHVAFRDMQGLERNLEQLQLQNQARENQNNDLNDQIAALQAKIASIQAALDVIVPSQNTYNLNPNQSVVIANGRLTIGLIGTPGDDSIDININGKRQKASVGDLINVAPDPETACQVKVQSFDMFKVQINASCKASKT
jgi:cell division protein FtsB